MYNQVHVPVLGNINRLTTLLKISRVY